jgi:hypothetical protein
MHLAAGCICNNRGCTMVEVRRAWGCDGCAAGSPCSQVSAAVVHACMSCMAQHIQCDALTTLDLTVPQSAQCICTMWNHSKQQGPCRTVSVLIVPWSTPQLGVSLPDTTDNELYTLGHHAPLFATCNAAVLAVLMATVLCLAVASCAVAGAIV